MAFPLSHSFNTEREREREREKERERQRPIALTPSTGKLFTTILRDRWLFFMIQNKFINRSIQKAFMPSIPGCIENHLKLMSALSEARKKHKLLAVCWLDLKNAYGSVHHSLIEYSLKHYHASPKFYDVVGFLYKDLSICYLF